MAEADQVNALIKSDIIALRDRVVQFTASIAAKPEYSSIATQHGTGSFVENAGRIWLLSNAHAIAIPDVTLGVTMRNGTEMHTLGGDRPMSSDADLAIIEIPRPVWECGDRRALDLACFRPQYDLLPGEICFFIGFPGAHSFTSAAERILRSRAFPYAGQQVGPIDEWVYYIHSNFDAMRDESGSPVAPFHFGGVSGSLVWNTRMLESVRNGVQWSPDIATPAGVIRGWQEKAGRLEVVHVKHVRDLFERGIAMLDQPEINEASA